MSPALAAKPPNRILRALLRLPVLVYRYKLGWLFGERLLLLNHVGRKSGKVHQTVVEVVDHDQATDTYYIVSGWGYNAQWYQNLRATPAIEIEVGRRKLAVVAQTLEPEDAVQVLLNYRSHHPAAARELSRLMGFNITNSTPEELEAAVRQSLPVLALRPRSTVA